MKNKEILSEFKKQWDKINLIKIFEIPVIDKRTNEAEYIIFDISIQGRTMYAHHESLTEKQHKAQKIAFLKIPIDTFFSIDSHLQELYSACYDAINESDFFEHV